MAKTGKPTTEAQVLKYFQQLDHPLAEVAEALRKVILAADPTIGEHIKWNSPAFYYTGPMKAFDPKEYKRDLVVFNLHKKDAVLLVFPTGAKVNDPSGILEGTFPDGRKTAKFTHMDEVKKQEKDLQTVVKAWLALVEK
ncbi:DUF1801 domain-containing protein [Telluribacter sp.]|jgi:hypothetical protein|uniref:DUF1801 domain-containing protein n=1 Tax=Telluribacter sp. TaxID=1978767 RepID=UPI002E132609|nr:DUF1801 domain-containing protein [Telluribacter sp.]